MFGTYETRLINGEIKQRYLPPVEYRTDYHLFKLHLVDVMRVLYNKGIPVRLRFRPTEDAINCPEGCMVTSPMRIEVVYDEVSIIGNIMLSNNQIGMMTGPQIAAMVFNYLLDSNTQMRIEFAKMRSESIKAYELAY